MEPSVYLLAGSGKPQGNKQCSTPDAYIITMICLCTVMSVLPTSSLVKFTRFAKKDSAKHFHQSICHGAVCTRTAKIIIVFILTIRCGTLNLFIPLEGGLVNFLYTLTQMVRSHDFKRTASGEEFHDEVIGDSQTETDGQALLGIVRQYLLRIMQR